MKKIFNYLLIVTLLLGTAVSFNSCKDDDEEDGKNGKGYNIVGTWKCSYDTGYYLWTLNADGTYVWVDKDYGYEADTDYGTYTYKDGVLVVYMGDEGEVWNLTWVDKNHFIDEDGDDWYRQ